jgi:putative ABC transport system ATP-binding protein
MRMLELRRVSTVYGQGTAGVHALADVSLSVDEGSMVAVMAPSGSGNSTLLTIAGTLEEPTSGEVLIDGVPADQHPGGKPAVDPGGHAAHRGAARLAAGRQTLE